MNNVATITRYPSDSKQTLGVLTTYSKVNELFVAKTLELPWKDNANDVSCIPVGEYDCAYTRSARLSRLRGIDVFTYEILNVSRRSGVRIHSANYFYQLLGCIALGDTTKDINMDGELDVIHSGATIDKFTSIMALQPFKLIIKNL